ncbi:MAG TPA: LysE family transporter [Methanoregula sp.]|nr:LysE family transporter [Methanoregula sp.]
MEIGLVIQGIIVGLILAVPVGPLSLICIQRTLSCGKLHGILSGFGITLADSVYAVIAFLGLAAISGFILSFEVPLRIFAGLVLIVVGARIIGFVPDRRQDRTGRERYSTAFFSMLALALANPMTLVFLMVTLPGYGFAFGGTSLVSAGWFVLGFITGSALWWVILCGAVGSFRARLTEKNLTLINHASGIFIAGIGAVMILAPVLALAGFTGS